MTQHAAQDVLRYTPSASDVAFYQEHGWWLSPKILPEDLLDDAEHAVERYYAGERDMPLLISGGYLDWRSEHGDVIRLNDYVSLQSEDLRRLVFYPVIAATAAALSGARSIRLFHDQLICKPPGLRDDQSNVGWHVDAAYWQTCSSRNMLTAWIPFQDCNDEMGSICVVDKSHLRDDTEWMKTFNERDLVSLERRLCLSGSEAIRELLPQRGQISFHHCRTIHGSRANRSARRRLALAIHLQDETNEYREHPDAHGRPVVHMNDLLCRQDATGRPDYSDPEICPELWSRDRQKRN